MPATWYVPTDAALPLSAHTCTLTDLAGRFYHSWRYHLAQHEAVCAWCRAPNPACPPAVLAALRLQGKL